MTPQKLRKPRRCLECGRIFKPMTDAQWKAAKLVHDDVSILHGMALQIGHPFD